VGDVLQIGLHRNAFRQGPTRAHFQRHFMFSA
jgi:hypothetical protein